MINNVNTQYNYFVTNNKSQQDPEFYLSYMPQIS